MQEVSYRDEEALQKAAQHFSDAGVFTERIGTKKLRSFHKGATHDELCKKLREAYDVAMRDNLADMVQVLKIGRNQKCPCGSGKKFKKCCIWKCQ